ncbi:hypothetical protein [Methylocystis parvus]|uniref:hypothetical protein n=1 Tax=Methylocystis parvus TaxID=134 RepID=UPI003C78868B
MNALEKTPDHPRFTRAPIAVDQLTLEAVSRDEIAQKNAKAPADVARLWEACQIPDYRKTSPAAHADLALSVFSFIARRGRIPGDWMARHIAAVDRIDGDIDTLSNRLAQVRTVSFIANRSGWLDDAEHWQSVARRVEDSLSDALHTRLTQRFVDRRTSVLMRRLRENAMLEAEINAAGDVLVEGQHVGSLQGFRFTPDPGAAGEAARALNAAAQKALAGEFEARATRVFDAVDDAFVLGNDGVIRWLGEPVAKIAEGPGVLTPTTRILADEQLTGAALEKVQNRLNLWLAQHVKKLLGPLETLEKGEGLEGVTRGVAFQIAEELGVLDRARVAKEIKAFSQEDRGALRKLGVRFGAYHIYLPLLLKPAPRTLASLLWALHHGGLDNVKGLEEVPHLAASGRTSFAADPSIHKGFYRAAGFRVCGERVVRVDILERLADLIRPAIAYKPGVTAGDPPPGTADGDGFVVTVAMTSLTGCSGEAFASILKSLGYASRTTARTRDHGDDDPGGLDGADFSQARRRGGSPGSGGGRVVAGAGGRSGPGRGDGPCCGSPGRGQADATVAEVEVPAPAEGEPADAPAETDEGACGGRATIDRSSVAAAPRPRRIAGGRGAGRDDRSLGPPAARPRRHHGQPAGQGEGERRNGPRRDRPRAAEGGADGGGRPGGRPQDKPRFDKPRFERGGPRDDRRGRPGGGFNAPEKRERQPDPDSPFAKLAALKAELEKKGKS